MRFRVSNHSSKKVEGSSDFKKYAEYFKSKANYDKEKDPLIREYRQSIAANMSLFR